MSWFSKKNEAPQPEEHLRADSKVSEEGTVNNRNRIQCVQILDQILSEADKRNKGVVLKLYVENFKNLNEVFGYDYCEKLLEQIVHFLEVKTKSHVYRYIGVEFIVVLEQFSQGQAMTLAEEILEQFDHVWKVDGTDCLCSAQVGLCSYPGYAAGVDEMLKCLERAVAKAAEHGPNQAVMYDSALDNQVQRRQAIATYLSTALEKNEIEVRYRPTYCMSKQKFTRAEYYMRIFIKGIGLVGEGEFLPVAEDSGQIRSVEYFALEKVGACISRLLQDGRQFESIALPVSSVLFLQEDFIDKVQEIMTKYRIPRGKLALEIKESTLITAHLNVHVLMQQLQDMGVEMILNEFGSGYSGITNILELPVDTLKLERLFVWQLETNPKAAYIIDGLIQIAKHMDLRLIAEGVETDHQIELLKEFGCDYQQGFFYSPTLEEDVLLQVLDTSLEDSKKVLEEAKERMRVQ